MNPNGKDGPTLKKIFTCEKCIYLSKSTLNGISSKYKYKCYHDDIISTSTRFNIMNGDITHDMITPKFCPFLMKMNRKEKLKELNNNI